MYNRGRRRGCALFEEELVVVRIGLGEFLEALVRDHNVVGTVDMVSRGVRIELDGGKGPTGAS
jgi:hypothetical protein